MFDIPWTPGDGIFELVSESLFLQMNLFHLPFVKRSQGPVL